MRSHLHPEASPDGRSALSENFEEMDGTRLREQVLSLLPEGPNREALLEGLIRLATLSVWDRMRPHLNELAESIGGTIHEVVMGENRGLHVVSRRYGDLRETATGTVWLHPGRPYRLTFAAGPGLEIIMQPGGAEDDGHSVSVDGGIALVVLGRQTFPKLLPLRLLISEEAGEPDLELLIQMNLTPFPYPKSPLLRLEYVLFWKAKESEEP